MGDIELYQLCPYCNRINLPEATHCIGCEAELGGRFWRVVLDPDLDGGETMSLPE